MSDLNLAGADPQSALQNPPLAGEMTAAFVVAKPWRPFTPAGAVGVDTLNLLPDGTVQGYAHVDQSGVLDG